MDSSILNEQSVQMASGNTFSVQLLVRALKNDLGPSQATVTTTTRLKYRQHLAKAAQAGVNPLSWHRKFNEYYSEARTYQIPDVQGFLGADDFLLAISYRIAPTWAQRERQELIKKDALGEPIPSLDQLSKALQALLQYDKLAHGTKNAGIFATLGGEPAQSSSSETEHRKGGNESRDAAKRGFNCPCLQGKNKTHNWAPTECNNLRYAYTGEKPDASFFSASNRAYTPPSQGRIKHILERLDTAKFAALKTDISKLKWSKIDWSKAEGGGNKFSKALYPGAVNA